MGDSRIDGNLHITGTLSAQSYNPPSGAISRNDQINTVSDPITANKLEQRHVITTYLSDHATDAAVKRVVAHIVQGASATIESFKAGVTVAATSTGEAVIDLKVNGVSVLSGTITLDSTNAAFSQESAPGFTDTDLATGDVVEVSINSVSGSALPKGVHTVLKIDEMP